jgi:acetyltransferase-like isoleucine patch superfamily enzyme
VLKQRVVNFIFQRVFRINSGCKYSIHYTSRIICPEKIILGNNYTKKSFIMSAGYYIQAINGVIIGKNTLFGPGVKIISANHDKFDYKKTVLSKPIKIGEECWIGANAIILPSVEIGDRVVVGAGSVVTKSFHGDVIIAGNPAKVIQKK